MATEPADENIVIKMSGDDDFSYRGVTHDARGTFDFLTEKISSLEAKVKYARGFGLIISVAKSSDCPEGKLAGATREGSDLERLERGIADLIYAEKKIEEIAGRRFPIQDGPSIPWRMILPHEGQHQKNHGGTLERMAERKGLSPDEALAVLDDESWTKSKWGNFTTDWSTRNAHPKVIAAKKELERRRAAFEDPIKMLEEELETVHANWDADRQELEDVIADSVPIRPDEKEVSAELLQIVHAILNCDEKTGPDKLCQCTRYIRDRFEALRSRLKKVTEQLNDTIKSRGEIIQQRDEAQNDRDGMTSERDRFNGSINRLAEIVGLSGKQCYAPDAVERKAKEVALQAEVIEKHLSTVTETRVAYQGCIERISEILGLGTDSCVPNAVERKAKLIAEEYRKSLAYAEFMNTQTTELNKQIEAIEAELQQAREDNSALKEYRTSVCPKERGPDDAGFTQEEAHFWKQTAERDSVEVQRLKKAAIDCDFHVLKCPILAGEDLELLEEKDGSKEVYGPGSIPGADPSKEVVLLDHGEPVVAVRKGTDFGCDNDDARPHSRCSVCDGSGAAPGTFFSRDRRPCEACDGTGNELGPPFQMCSKMPECPNKECPHFKLEDNRCGRKAEDHIVQNPGLNLGPVDGKENVEEVQD